MRLFIKRETFVFIVFLLVASCEKESDMLLMKNSPPVANAGSDIIIALPDDSTILSGEHSYDSDIGDSIANYEWRKISGPNYVSIENKNRKETKIRGLKEGTYVFELTVKIEKDCRQKTV